MVCFSNKNVIRFLLWSHWLKKLKQKQIRNPYQLVAHLFYFVLFIYLLVYLFIYLFIYLLIYLFIYLFIYFFTYLFTYLFIYLFIQLIFFSRISLKHMFRYSQSEKQWEIIYTYCCKSYSEQVKRISINHLSIEEAG